MSLEAFKIGIDNLSGYQLTIKTYDKENGWVRRNNVNDGTLNGTEGKSLPSQLFLHYFPDQSMLANLYQNYELGIVIYTLLD